MSMRIEKHPGHHRVFAGLISVLAVCIGIGCNKSPAEPGPTPTPSCTFLVGDGPAGSLPASGTEFTVSITVAAGCSWTASSNAPFVTATPAAGTGTGSVRFTVQANPGGARQTTIVVANRTIDVRQDAFSPCAFSVDPPDLLVMETGGDFGINVKVTSGQNCAWTASSNSSFISIKQGASGTGDGTVVVTVAPNPGDDRFGQLTVAGQLIPVKQLLQPCVWVFTPSRIDAPKAGLTGAVVNFTKTAGGTCNWTIKLVSNWLTFTPISGAGSGSVRIDVAPNFGPARGAQIDFTNNPNGPHFDVVQEAGPSPVTVTVTKKR